MMPVVLLGQPLWLPAIYSFFLAARADARAPSPHPLPLHAAYAAAGAGGFLFQSYTCEKYLWSPAMFAGG